MPEPTAARVRRITHADLTADHRPLWKSELADYVLQQSPRTVKRLWASGQLPCHTLHGRCYSLLVEANRFLLDGEGETDRRGRYTRSALAVYDPALAKKTLADLHGVSQRTIERLWASGALHVRYLHLRTKARGHPYSRQSDWNRYLFEKSSGAFDFSFTDL
jgi:hypothetical protein